jgi:hypothetical protein
MQPASGAIPVILLLLAAAPACAQTIAPIATRTIGRTVDTIVVKGEATGKAIGAPIDRLRLFACKGGKLEQVVLQIDERTPDGGYCYDQGPAERRVKDVDGGKLDANDEVLFLARDVGDRVPPAALQLKGLSAVQELEVTDPVDGGKGWVYLTRWDGIEIPVRPNTWLVGLQVKKHTEEEKTFTWRGEKFVFANDKSRRGPVHVGHGRPAVERHQGRAGRLPRRADPHRRAEPAEGLPGARPVGLGPRLVRHALAQQGQHADERQLPGEPR